MKDIAGWEIIGLHAAVFLIAHSEARDRVHDLDGLEAVVVRPGNYRHYRDADLALQAAALAHGIAERQIFIDGNKRTAALAMLYFLESNGFVLSASEDDLFDWMVCLAHGWGPEELGTAIRPTLVALNERSVEPPALPRSRHRRRPHALSQHVRPGRHI